MVNNISYVYQADECALHGNYVRATGIVLYRNDFATITTQLQVACMQWPKTYLTFNLLLKPTDFPV